MRKGTKGIIRVGTIAAAIVMPGAAQAATGDIYVTDNTGGPAEVIKIDPATGAQTVFASGGLLTDLRDVTIAANGDLLVADLLPTDEIIRITPAGAQSVFASGPPLAGPRGVEFGPSGDLFAADNGPTATGPALDGLVVKVDPAGAKSTLTAGGNLVNTNGIAFSQDGTIILADLGGDVGTGAATPDGKVVKVDPNTGAQSVLSAGGSLISPIGIAVQPGGPAFAGDLGPAGLGGTIADGALTRVDTASGGQTALSSGQNLMNPQQVARDANGNPVVVDTGPGLGDADGRVVRVDRTTGAQALLTIGGNLHDPRGIAVEPPRCGGLLATLVGTAGKDKFSATSFADVIYGGGGKDKINGRGGNDVICGHNGKDTLKGGSGKDKLIGGKGDDKLVGGKGKDKLKGGKGDDTTIP